MTLKTSAVTFQPALSFMGVAHRLPFMSPEIPKLWDTFFAEGHQYILEQLRMDDPIDEPFDFIGFMTDMDLAKQEMTYVIGCLVHPKTPDQPDYSRYDLEASEVITTVIVGTEAKVYPRAHRLTEEAAAKKGLTPKGPWAMEIYTQRFMDSKERNNGVIEMDYRIPVMR